MVEISRKEFELLVARSLRRLPRRFRARLENIAVVVEDWADDETLDDMGIEPPDTLYGLYRGTDLTRRDTNYGNVLPDVITIYQGPIQEDCDTVEDMEELVRDTVIHEVGHYFGLDDELLGVGSLCGLVSRGAPATPPTVRPSPADRRFPTRSAFAARKSARRVASGAARAAPVH
jgi:predicted Zn-dependent protease with MMP-like domain